MVTRECPESNQYILLAIYNPMGGSIPPFVLSFSIVLSTTSFEEHLHNPLAPVYVQICGAKNISD